MPSIVVANPSFDDVAPVDDKAAEQNQPGFFKRHSMKFLVFGVVAVAGVVGFVAGSSVSEPASVEATTAIESLEDSVSRANAVLEAASSDPSNLAFASGIPFSVLNEQVDAYIADPSLWDDMFLTKEVMEAFVTLRSSAGNDATPVRRLNNYRDLIGSFPESIVSSTWNEIDGADYSSGIVYENDAVLVKSTGGICYIISQESNEAGDWWDNLDIGSDPIMSINKKTVQDESCGCAQSRWYGCASYKSCSVYYSLGNGFDGFAKTYNAMRQQIWSRIKSVCSSSDVKLFGGYSRGGGIMSIMAFAMYKEGLIPSSSMKLVTFGCPRAIGKSESDAVHSKFEQYRMIYKKDPVPSLPYGWMGFKHFGNMRCNSCGYSESRDAPGWGWPTDAGDHTSYDEWF